MIVKITTAAVSGALFPEKSSQREISVNRTEKQPVIVTGYISATDVKGADGEYKPSAYGRLPVEGAKASDGRIVLAVAGGLRGVLFPAKTAGDNIPDYSGTLETGKEGEVFPIFARKRTGKSGPFLSISSGAPEEKRAPAAESAVPETADGEPSFADDDIPF